jgi:hypothetical protein
MIPMLNEFQKVVSIVVGLIKIECCIGVSGWIRLIRLICLKLLHREETRKMTHLELI